MHRVFLLSPAHVGGKRAGLLFNPRAGFALARELQSGAKRPLGEIFRFVSGLYFRGKLAYAETFAQAPPGCPGGLIITTNRGLVPMDTPTSLARLRAFATTSIDATEERYRRPLERTARRLLAAAPRGEFVLLGSISTNKYVDVLLTVFGDRLLFPVDFVGRGDMSRGGLLLRCVRDHQELTYGRVAGAVRRGRRPPRLASHSWRGTPWQAEPVIDQR